MVPKFSVPDQKNYLRSLKMFVVLMATLAPCQLSLNVAKAHGLRAPSFPKLAMKDGLVTS